MENMKQLLIPVTLKGENYLLWSRTTKTALCSRGLWSHIEATGEPASLQKSKSLEGAEKLKWFQEDQTVLGAIQSSLELSILEAYSYCETASELWETLKQVYGNISNFTRVFEVKRALANLQQEDMEFKKHFGKFRSLWAELEMLRPSTVDPSILNERREQDKVFGLLLTLRPALNDLIKHILRADKLPSLEEVCAQVQKEEGSQGLFSGKEELAIANKGVLIQEEQPKANKSTYKQEDRRAGVCDHCKRRGHTKDKCWQLHPHLKPVKFRENRAHLASESYPSSSTAQASTSQEEKAMVVTNAQENLVMKRSDLEAIIQSLAAKIHSGISLHSYQHASSLVVDSGASHHMISNPGLLSSIEPILGSVCIANGDRIPIEGIGNLELFGKQSKAFYMPKFTSNLLSVKKTTKDLNCLAIFGPNSVNFQDIKTGKVFGQGEARDELYVLSNLSKLSEEKPSNSALISANSTVVLDKVWHARLGHPHTRALELLLPNVTFNSSKCEACILGKHCRIVFPKSTTIYEDCFDLVHSDVWTSPCLSRDNNKYFVTFIDEKSKYTWLTLIQSKDRVLDAFVNFQNYVSTQYNAKIKIFRTDNGGEYTGQAFKAHLAKHGIIHQTSCPYTPQQNGVAERKNRHLMEVARSMMFHHNVPKRFWGDAVVAACYVINRIPTQVLKNASPFEVLNHSKPVIDHLRVFGCVCFVFVPNGQRNKLEAKSIKCIFLGYSITQKGYKCFEPATNRTYISREVKFLEDQGFYVNKDWEGLKDISNPTSDRATSLRFILDELGNAPAPAQPPSAPAQPAPAPAPADVTPGEQSIPPPNSPLIYEEESVSETSIRDEPSDHVEDTQAVEETQVVEEPVLRRSSRVRKDPANWANTRVYFNGQAIAHPIQAVHSLALVPADHQAFLSKIDAHVIPQSYEEAKSQKAWNTAVEDEVGAMIRNHTWDEEVLPPGKKCVSSKWVFTIKYKSTGEVERYKARLVARGFTQTYGVDYEETFAPVAKQPTVKVLLSLATNLDWDLWQMDVKNAFLQGELDEEVYMTPPPGLEASVTPGKVLRLRKAIYGLKQSPRAWYHKLSTTLKDNGFHKSEADHTLFTLCNDQGIVAVLVYVDDLIITGSNKAGIQSIKASLHSAFDIKDLGELKYFLGIEVCRSKEGLFLSQRKYTLDLLSLTGKLGCKPAKTPLEAGYKVTRKGEKNDTPYQDVAQYRRLVGKLIYLTYTRPDISFAVNQISQHMQAPTMHHWSLVERILRYLKGNPGQGIWMGRNGSTEIVGYCDADWASDRNDRRSTTGYCTFIGGNLCTWKTKKQKVVSGSSAEAEYRAMGKLTDELVWLKALLKDLDIESPRPITMHCDNQAAIHIANNSVFHERTKHIEIDCHKVREKIEEGIILPCYTRSEDQLADIFTKAASLKVCQYIHSKLGLADLTHP